MASALHYPLCPPRPPVMQILAPITFEILPPFPIPNHSGGQGTKILATGSGSNWEKLSKSGGRMDGRGKDPNKREEIFFIDNNA
jgi:hypothetical protein